MPPLVTQFFITSLIWLSWNRLQTGHQREIFQKRDCQIGGLESDGRGLTVLADVFGKLSQCSIFVGISSLHQKWSLTIRKKMKMKNKMTIKLILNKKIRRSQEQIWGREGDGATQSLGGIHFLSFLFPAHIVSYWIHTINDWFVNLLVISVNRSGLFLY